MDPNADTYTLNERIDGRGEDCKGGKRRRRREDRRGEEEEYSIRYNIIIVIRII